MKERKIKFAKLRDAYEEVKTFLIENQGAEATEIHLYADLEDNLGIIGDDLIDFIEKDFAHKFDIKELQVKLVPQNNNEILHYFGIILLFFLYLSILPFIIITWLFYQKPKFKNKKTWNKDKISVADLICMVIEKKYVLKKNIFYRL